MEKRPLPFHNPNQSQVHSCHEPGPVLTNYLLSYPQAVRIGIYFSSVTVIASTGQKLTHILQIWQSSGYMITACSVSSFIRITSIGQVSTQVSQPIHERGSIKLIGNLSTPLGDSHFGSGFHLPGDQTSSTRHD